MPHCSCRPWPSALPVARLTRSQLSRKERCRPMTTMALRERPATQANLESAEGALRSARLLHYEAAREAWEDVVAQQAVSLSRRADLLLAATNSVQRAADAIDWIYSSAGTTGIFTKSPLERHFRDIHVMTQHAFFSFSRYETVGQVYLGLPPRFRSRHVLSTRRRCSPWRTTTGCARRAVRRQHFIPCGSVRVPIGQRPSPRGRSSDQPRRGRLGTGR